MTSMGSVAELFRYPVKSMLGDSVDQLEVDDLGVVGDRGWAVRDERRGDFSTGKRIAALMDCRAEQRAGGGVPLITLPDGTQFSADAADAAERMSAALAHPVTIWPVGASAPEPQQVEEVADPAADFRSITARVGDEPDPDFSQIPDELLGFMGREGRPFVDLAPLLVMTTQSITTLAAAAPESRVDSRRFRPSLLIDAAGGDAFPEQGWLGRRLRLGEVVLALPMTCPRCVMTTHGFADLPKDPGVMRKLVSHADGNLGVYASVERSGPIRVGDPVELLD